MREQKRRFDDLCQSDDVESLLAKLKRERLLLFNHFCTEGEVYDL